MEYLILSLGILSLILGISVILKSHKENTNIAFLFFTLSLGAWAFNNYYMHPNPPLQVLRMSYGLAIVMGMTYLIWIYSFLKKSVPRPFLYVTIPAFLVLFGITVHTDLIIKALYSTNGVGFDGELGSYYLLFTSFFTFVIFFSLYHLIQTRITTQDLILRKKITIVVWGISLFALNSFSVDFWIPRVFGKLHYTLLDNIGFLVLLLCMTYVMLARIKVSVKNNLLLQDTMVELYLDNNEILPNIEPIKNYDEYMNRAPEVIHSVGPDTTYKNK